MQESERAWLRSLRTAEPRLSLATLFLVDGIGFGAWASHVPAFKQILHLENSSLTFVLVSLVVGSLLAMPLTGQMIARFGSRVVIRMVAVTYCASMLLLAQSESFVSLILFAGFYGAVKGALDVSVNAQAFAVEEHYGHSSMSFLQGCWSVGSLTGAALSGALLHHNGTVRSDLSLVAAILALLCAGALPRLVSDKTPSQRAAKFVLPDAALMRLAILAFFGLLVEGAVADWAPVYLHSDISATLSMSAAGYAAYAITMTVTRFCGDAVARKFSGRRILQASGLLIAGGVGLVLLSRSYTLAAVGLMFTGVGTANIVPVILGAAGRDTRLGPGPAISAVSTVGYFGLLAGPPIIGGIATIAGLRLALSVLAVCGIIVATGAMLLETKLPVKAGDRALQGSER
ncbi:Major Facilitator Superfamily transporter [Terriglobus roseus DSM 18391]|uniref:Major Facilitator Superfamily transporter n=1 Tax=Terriglobus roseus (strain DSM 18391 / NRRL B-41598 / KBS 63) TaxID=926566 RepID=I3ZIZ3_TERRK|nr:MFS transporter [Terriglobus roseus]AFL89211.1 Major Facilitator Superfamily transporter [Terriglobus roseus DSM 18391]